MKNELELTQEEESELKAKVEKELQALIKKNKNNEYKDDVTYQSIVNFYNDVFVKNKHPDPFKTFWAKINDLAKGKDYNGNPII